MIERENERKRMKENEKEFSCSGELEKKQCWECGVCCALRSEISRKQSSKEQSSAQRFQDAFHISQFSNVSAALWGKSGRPNCGAYEPRQGRKLYGRIGNMKQRRERMRERMGRWTEGHGRTLGIDWPRTGKMSETISRDWRHVDGNWEDDGK